MNTYLNLVYSLFCIVPSTLIMNKFVSSCAYTNAVPNKTTGRSKLICMTAIDGNYAKHCQKVFIDLLKFYQSLGILVTKVVSHLS